MVGRRCPPGPTGQEVPLCPRSCHHAGVSNPDRKATVRPMSSPWRERGEVGAVEENRGLTPSLQAGVSALEGVVAAWRTSPLSLGPWGGISADWGAGSCVQGRTRLPCAAPSLRSPGWWRAESLPTRAGHLPHTQSRWRP